MDRRSHQRDGDDADERTLSSCLDEEQALAYAFGRSSNTVPDDLARHVDGCPRCQTLVAEAARAHFASETTAPRSPQARTLRDGELALGRYEIVRFIGAGGMGEVYEALDRELGEKIALKTVALTTLDSQRAVTRLKAEVQLARRTTHPNVCRIFDFGVHLRPRPGLVSEPIPLLTMELLAGETLARFLRRSGRLTVQAARPIVRQVLAGLEAVHAAQIVHRDLKAENVFLVEGGTAPRVVLMDFGLARPALPSGSASFSIHHTLVGTASYMAPEQVEGRAVSFASDVYAVGVLMFELVTGRMPFEGETAMEVAVRRLKEAPPRPSSLVADLDPRWEEAILRCLARAPADRFQSVGALAAALDERAPAPVRWPRRWPTLVAGLGLTLVMGLVLVPRLTRQPARPSAGEAVMGSRPTPPPAVVPTVVEVQAAVDRAPPAPVAVEAPPPRPHRPRRARPHGHDGGKVAAPTAASPPARPAAPPTRLDNPDGIINPFSDAH